MTGLVEIFTGNGRGKSTAALGVTLPILDYGLQVHITYLKKDEWGKRASSLPFRQGSFFTTSIALMGRLYTPAHIAELDSLKDIGFPGEHPSTSMTIDRAAAVI